MKTISKDDYFKVLGILSICIGMTQKLEFMEEELAKIFDIPKEYGSYGHVSDAVWGEYAADSLLEKLGLEVES